MGNKKILLYHLDDDPSELDKFKIELQKIAPKTVELRSFRNSSSLMKALSQPPRPNLVFLDIDLNEKVTGLQLCKRIKEQYNDVFISIYSNHVTVSTIQLAQECGADDVISKVNPHHRQADHLLQVYSSSRIENIVAERKKVAVAIADKNIVGSHTRQHITNMLSNLAWSKKGGILITGEQGTGKSFLLELFLSCLPPLVSKSLISKSIADMDHSIELERALGGWLLVDDLEHLTVNQQNHLMKYVDEEKSHRSIRIIATSRLSIDDVRKSENHSFALIRYLMSNRIALAPLFLRKYEIPEFVEYFLSKVPNGPYMVQNVVKQALYNYEYRHSNLHELQDVLQQVVSSVSGNNITAVSIPSKILDYSVNTKATFSDADFFEILLKSRKSEIDFFSLTDQLLLILIEKIQELDKPSGKRHSLLSLAKRIGVSRTAIRARLDNMVKKNEISKEELKKLLKS